MTLRTALPAQDRVFETDFKRKGMHMNHRQLLTPRLGLTLAALLALPLQALADGDHKHAADKAQTQAQAQAAPADMTNAEVRKVDKESGKLTLKHGEIKSLDMPAMTMVFTVRDKAMLDKVKAGDTVRFKAVNDAGKFTVTEMQVVK